VLLSLDLLPTNSIFNRDIQNSDCHFSCRVPNSLLRRIGELLCNVAICPSAPDRPALRQRSQINQKLRFEFRATFRSEK
jgi:hypothetical protein